ncbi:unnamed protein product [Heterotrigona itama]|uniref:Uncharacterized protein n=1 Tax=Heterotrigona itama TaxID=395501 RepID=A0A6V7HDI8_9HYME|nr:unnamed protein product [Heterotrigona itama]
MHHSTKSHQGALGPRCSHLDRARERRRSLFCPRSHLSLSSPFSFALSLLCSQPPSESALQQFQPRPRSKQILAGVLWWVGDRRNNEDIRLDGSQHSEHDTLFHWISFSRYVWRFEMILRVMLMVETLWRDRVEILEQRS